MLKLIKFLIGCVVFFIAFGIVAAAYEQFNGGPWYTMVNASGDRVIMGQNVRTTYQVYDEKGTLIDTVPGWKFENEAPNSLVKDSDGTLHFKSPQQMPQWMEITNTVLQPFLKAGHFVVDNVILFFKQLK
jgi:hypothetical protein